MPINFYINLFLFILNLALIFFIYLKISKSLYKTATILFLIGVLSRPFVLMVYQDPFLTLSNVKWIVNIWSIFDIGLSSLFLFFNLVFTERTKILKSKFFISIIFLIPLFFAYQQFAGNLINTFVRTPLGWEGIISNSLATDLFNVYFFIFNVFGLFLIFNFRLKTKEWIKRKRADLFLIAGFLYVFFDIFISFLLRRAEIIFPNRIDLPSLIWCIVIFYAIIKYKFLIATLSEAAENIVSVMPDGLFFLDANRNIVRVNQSIFNSLGYSEKELIGEPIEKFFNPSEINLIQELVSTSIVKDKQVKLKNKDGKEIPFIISGVAVKNQDGDLYYIILFVKDAQEIKKYAALRLSELTPILQKVSQGDFSKTIEIPAEKDEFTEHLLTLNIMIDNFKKLVKEINDKSVQLEYQNKELEKVSSQLQQKMIELERFNNVAVGRDVQLNELSKELEKLKS